MADPASARTAEDPTGPGRVLRRVREALADRATRFAAGVVACAVALVAGLAARGGFDALAHPSRRLVVFLVLAAAGELWLMRLPSRTTWTVISASSPFVLATILVFGPGAAILALVVGSVTKDLRARRAPVKLAFNAAQYAVAIVAAAAVYDLLGGTGGVLAGSELLPAVAAAVAYLLTNSLLTAAVVGRATGTRLLTQMRSDLEAWLLIEAVMLGFAPVVAVTTERSLWLIPLLALPFLGVRQSAKIAMASDHAAMHDALTGLPNRVLFRTRVVQALERRRHAGIEVVVMLLDLDRFKEVNDTLGHGKGDELLCGIAARLTLALPEVEVVARLGGDEFGVLVCLPAEDRAAVEALAGRIREALDQPFVLSDMWVDAGASIGIASAALNGGDPETLLLRADVAMYLAKENNTGWELYDPARDPNAPERLDLIRELRVGIDADQLVLHYQPKISVATGELTGFEALVRWQHPTRGLLGPHEFIELAERTDNVRRLTTRVIEQALRQVAAWGARGHQVPVAVNLSARVLLDVTLPAEVERLLQEAGVAPALLEVEVTESSLIADPERTAHILERLHRTGVRVSIDDFGTGYSSLVSLRRLPVDAIKIDRSFVIGMDESSEDAAIVASTIALADNLGLDVVAEGVETTEALDRLRDMGCQQAQGYLMCRPQPAEQLEDWLLDRRFVPA